MPPPCLSLAIDRLQAAEPRHYAIWIWKAPYPGGHVHFDRMWTDALTDTWHLWQSFFSLRDLPDVPRFPATLPPLVPEAKGDGQPISQTSRLMQNLGVSLWQWIFDGPIHVSFSQSQGIAMGQMQPLRLRLEIRDPELIELPWEIMQPQPGKQAVSLSKQLLLFSRTTSDVDPLPPLRPEQYLKILLVLGQDSDLDLEREANALASLLENVASGDPRNSYTNPVGCQVTTLIQPTPTELIERLETGTYNLLFYAGHGAPAPDGGLLFLRPDATINGTELAQVLVRCQVKLAVFNACWGAQPAQQGQKAIARSSLAEVLIHHGVPAVLAMRDLIGDQEAISFIQVFARALAERSPIDEAVAIARQQLLTVYGFNQAAWTLPVLYLHPEFNGELIRPILEGVTEIPDTSASWIGRHTPPALLRSLEEPDRSWPIRGGIMRVGSRDGNDLVLREPGVSREHAEIVFRDSAPGTSVEPTYLLRDRSRWGTWVCGPEGNPDNWYMVHHQEVPLQSKMQIKFGSLRSQPLEFLLEG